MQTIFYVLISVYIFAINFYSVLMLKMQKKSAIDDESTNQPISDGRLIFSAFMGGSLGLYLFMFIFKYKLKNILMMTLIPVLLALNIFVFIFLYRNGYNFISTNY